MNYETLIAVAVEKKLVELDTVPMGRASGRRLELGGSNPAAIPEIYRLEFTGIARTLGLHFFEQTPAVALDQLVVMAASKAVDSAGLLKSLIDSFLVAYVTPETSQCAYDHLVRLELLREQVATSRKLLTSQMLDIPASQKH